MTKPKLSDKARKAIFAKGGRRNRTIEASTPHGGSSLPTAGVPDLAKTPGSPKFSTLSRKSRSWAGA